jgi:hypothetical protein
MRRFVLRRPTRSGLTGLSLMAAAFAACLGGAPAARAQSDECQSLAKLLKSNSEMVQRFQAEAKSKKLNPQQACSSLSAIQSTSNSLAKALEANGAWCHAPDNLLPQIKQLAANVGKSRAQACSVAEKMKKMQSQQAQGGGKQGPLGGTGDILGGPIKVPQGAL